MTQGPSRLVDRSPSVSREALLNQLRPPPQFADVRLSTFRPDPEHVSQRQALSAVTELVADLSRPEPLRRRLLPRRAPARSGVVGLYLDGGFGVGKTHLLASAWHEAPDPKAYLSFTQLTQLVGALGFAAVAERLGSSRLVCIDEFELDDPGDTVLVSTLLTRITARGVRVAATSNTLPGALGEGRFDTTDFVREIQSLADRFRSVRIDGPDFRHRDLPTEAYAVDTPRLQRTVLAVPSSTSDDFPALLQHLRSIHPSRYGALLDGVSLACICGVSTLHDQSDALRLVVLADRLYEGQVPVVASGTPFDQVFDAEMLSGGYRKKYLRAVSRLSALTRLGRQQVVP